LKKFNHGIHIIIVMNSSVILTEDDNISELLPHKKLSQIIWESDKLRPEIRDRLLKIAAEFYFFLRIPTPIEDILLTGSMANYNYSKMSDIDLHLLIDFSKVDKNQKIVKDLLDAKRALWNDRHDITIKAHDVEVYAQDKDETHFSTGTYSVIRNEWIRKPKQKKVEIDFDAIIKKSKNLMSEIDKVLKSPNRLAKIDRLKEKIKKMRQCGLEEGGEYSVENLTFKILRREGYLEKLYDTARADVDAQLSLNSESVVMKKILKKLIEFKQ